MHAKIRNEKSVLESAINKIYEDKQLDWYQLIFSNDLLLKKF